MKHKFFYIFSIMILLTGILPANAAPVSQDYHQILNNSCDQTALDQAEAKFRSRLSENGQVPVNDPIAKAAALEVMHLSKKCYDVMQAERNSQNLQGDQVFIDEGPVDRYAGRAEAFKVSDAKWGSSSFGTPGGTVTYSFMGSGLDLSNEGAPNYGNSTAFTSLNGFQSCFITEIQTAFAAWSAIANIDFVQVADSNTAFDADGATGDIRIGAHAFGGPYGTLAHAYLPYNYWSGDGDIHFDKDETWSCTTSGGFDIGLVAMHEIGHAIGLYHDDTPPVAVMDPTYNSSLTSLQSDDIAGARTIYGAAPLAVFDPAPNDTSATAIEITGLTYNNQVDTTATTPDSETADATDPDPITCTDALGNTDSLEGGWSTVWYKYKTPTTEDESIQADTKDTNYDTYIAVYEGDASGNLITYTGFVGCNDDSLDGQSSRISFTGIKDTWYYFEVGQFRCYEGEPGTACDPPGITGGDLIFNVNITNTDVSIGGDLMEQYYLYPTSVQQDEYIGIDNGPLNVVNINSDPIIPSLRVIFESSGKQRSYTELMGFPSDQLTNEYFFPWYNNVGLNSQIRIGNAGASTTVKVYIAGALKGSYPLDTDESVQIKYNNVDNGPVRIVSTNVTDEITTAMRVIFELGGKRHSYSELMGFPADSLTNEYLFPWYNNVGLNSQIRIGNVGASTTVKVYIAGALKGSYPLDTDESVQIKYTGVDNGPVRIVSTNGADKITAAMRVIFEPNGKRRSYSELMGFPSNQLTDNYYLPMYNNVSANSQLRIGNAGASTTVTVEIGGVWQGDYPLDTDESVQIKYAGLDDGPVYVYGANATDEITVAMRMIFEPYGSRISYSEIMGYPGDQLTAEYLFPWYNNIGLNSELRIAVP